MTWQDFQFFLFSKVKGKISKNAMQITDVLAYSTW